MAQSVTNKPNYMTKLLNHFYSVAVFIAIAAAAWATPSTNGTILMEYRQKDITFGDISSRQGAVYALADLYVFNSFHFGASVANNLSLKNSSLYQTDLLVGYKFFSALADVEFGAVQIFQGKPALQDMGQRFRPFVAISRGIITLTGRMDLEAETTNAQIDVTKTISLGRGFAYKVSGYTGYTDVNNSLPRSVKELKYTNFYYGGDLGLEWKVLNAGIYVLRSGHTNDTTFGWRAGMVLKF